MATVTVNTLEFVSALRALIPISKQATLYSGEKERNAATIAARITPAKKLALITGNSALGAIASVRIEQAVEAGEREFCLYTDDAKNITSIFKPNKQNSEEPLRLEFGNQLDNENIMIAETHKAYGNTELIVGNLAEDAEITDTLLNDLYLSVNNPEAPESPNFRDVTAVDWETVPPVDIISGGSPCQDVSLAGARRGMTDGTRSNLWVSMREAIKIIRPRLVVWENVKGARSATASSDLEPCPGCMGTGGG